MPNRLVALLALATLSGCAGGSTIGPLEVTSGYQPRELAASAAQTPVSVAARGRPFGLDDQAAAARIALLLPTGTAAGRNFSPAATVPDRPVHHLVFDFAATGGETADELCRGGRLGSTAAPAGRMTVFGALCVGATPLSWAVGSTDASSGADSPEFRRFISDVAYALLPGHTQIRGGSSR